MNKKIQVKTVWKTTGVRNGTDIVVNVKLDFEAFEADAVTELTRDFRAGHPVFPVRQLRPLLLLDFCPSFNQPSSVPQFLSSNEARLRLMSTTERSNRPTTKMYIDLAEGWKLARHFHWRQKIVG